MSKHSLKAVKRDLEENPTQLRMKKLVPANIFGPKMDSQAIQLELNSFYDVYRQIGESGVAYLELGKEEIPAMIEEVQKNPVTDQPIHVSFKAIDLTQKVTAEIPVDVIGEFELPEAVLVTVRDEIEVEALPTDLPEKFEVDVSGLDEIGQSITLADLEYDSDKVSIVVGEEGMDAPVVLVQEVEEEPEEPEEPIETEIIGEEEVEEGEGVEGEAEVEEGVEAEEAGDGAEGPEEE